MNKLPKINLKINRHVQDALIGTGVILALATILIPVFAKPKSGRGDGCFSKLKLMWMATSLYGEDSDGHYPLADSWMDGLVTYVGGGQYSERVFHDTTTATDPTYGYAFRDRALRGTSSAIRNPSEFILIFDSDLAGRNRHSELWSLPQQGRHQAGSPYLRGDKSVCADGHTLGMAVRTAKTDPPGMSPFEKDLMADDESQQSLKRLAPTAKVPQLAAKG